MKLKTLLVLSAVLTVIMMTIMILHGKPLKLDGITPHGIIDLELARTPERANEIYQAWKPELIRRAISNTYVDFLFLIAYGCLLYSLCISISRWYNGYWKVAGKWLAIAMIVASVFDAIENILMLKTLNGSMGKELIASTFMFAAVKFLLVIAAVLYIAISAARRLLANRQPAAITLED